jgi:peptide/nickel transport system permease protein
MVLQRLIWRLLSIAVLLIALIFFLALLMQLGARGGLTALPSAFSSAVEFTVEYVKGLAQGDLGEVASRSRSIPGTPVIKEIGRALPKSLALLLISLGFSVIVGVYLGLVSARRRSSLFSGLVLFASSLGVSTPSYFAAMLLIWLGVWLYAETGRHVVPLAGFGWDAHIVLPALVLAARPAAAVTRLGHNSLVEIFESDYVRTARSKGLHPQVVLLSHVLRNAGVPILTTVLVSLRFGLAVLPIVEYIFSWPGIGLSLLNAIQAGDATAAIGMILTLALLFVLANLLLESLYLRIDPRLQNSKVAVT